MSDEKLEVPEKTEKKEEVSEEKKSELIAGVDRKKDLLKRQIDNMKTSIEQAVGNLVETITPCEEDSITPSQTVGFQKTANDILQRIEDPLQKLVCEYCQVLTDGELEDFQVSFLQFVSKHTASLDSVQLMIVQKTKVYHVDLHGRDTTTNPERVMLKRIDPPKYNGDIIEFLDFQSKWKATVGKAKLGQEAELDRLRENVPQEAAKMLVGETTISGAWKTLSSLYGNKTLLANKLKSKLKTISLSRKEDHDLVIELSIEVKSIVARLTELNLQDMLKYDDEYLAAVFRFLPNQERIEWLKYNKDRYDTQWEAMLEFLQNAHHKATETKVLLSSYAAQASTKSEKKVTTAQVKVDKQSVADISDSDDQADNQEKDKERKKAKTMCGQCPLCDSSHSFTRRRDNLSGHQTGYLPVNSSET